MFSCMALEETAALTLGAAGVNMQDDTKGLSKEFVGQRDLSPQREDAPCTSSAALIPAVSLVMFL